MRVCVIDGQGGGMGAVVIKALRSAWGEEVEVWALGTNAVATAQMMKAGANRGASGENAICVSAPRCDAIVAPMSVIVPNAMMGEVTPRLAAEVAGCGSRKFLLPLTQEPLEVVGVVMEPLPHLVEKLVQRLKEHMSHV